MRYFLLAVVGVIALAAGAAGGVLIYRHLNAGPPVVLPAPSKLEAASAGGTRLLPGGWTNSPSVLLRTTGWVAAGMDVEVRPLGRKFANDPTQTLSADCAPSTCAGTDPQIAVHLANGAYHWQARLHNQDGVSPWVVYRGIVRVDTVPPGTPSVSSPTDPDPTKTYHSSTLRFSWQDTDTSSGIAGYSYRLDTDPKGVARTELRTQAGSVTLAGLETGRYYFHVRALDRAGNWSGNATFPVRIDVTPPGLAHVRFSLFQLDPQFDKLVISFAVTRPAREVRLGVYRQSDGSMVRLYRLTGLAKGQHISVAWDGKDGGGRAVPAGAYEVYVRPIDRYGHSSLTGWRDFIVDYRRILVSLSQQKLWAYDGSRVLLTSLVTTGNRALPTPTGTFHILGKFHPFTFKSPWPKSSIYYYPPSKTEWAMLFREGGYFIHDAPWRSVFGPGSNAGVGKPGDNYTGTHGCINVPSNVALDLYRWAKVGTVVQVVG